MQYLKMAAVSVKRVGVKYVFCSKANSTHTHSKAVPESLKTIRTYVHTYVLCHMLTASNCVRWTLTQCMFGLSMCRLSLVKH